MTPEWRGQYARKPGTTAWIRAWPLSPGGSRAYSRHVSDFNPQRPPPPVLGGGWQEAAEGTAGALLVFFGASQGLLSSELPRALVSLLRLLEQPQR